MTTAPRFSIYKPSVVLIDINVLVYAHREDADNHSAYRDWLQGTLDSDAPFGLADLVLSGLLRILTHSRIFSTPTPPAEALAFATALRAQPNCISIAPGARHWEIFSRLCTVANVRGNLVPDTYLAALAIESGSEWITTDRDYSRFPGLRWRHPLPTQS